jgi:hypothetical protein
MSLRTLLDRFVKGGEVATFTPVYNGDDVPDMSKMDMIEKIDYVRNHSRKVNDMYTAMKEIAEDQKNTVGKQPKPPKAESTESSSPNPKDEVNKERSPE